MKKWMIACVAAACFLAAAPRSYATVLSPGDGPLTAVVDGIPGGSTLKTSQTGTFSASGAGGKSITGHYYNAVYLDSVTGKMDFLFQVTSSTAVKTVIDRIAPSSFFGYTTDVGYQSPGTHTPTTVARTSDGSAVDFNFAPFTSGSTKQLIIKTNASTYDNFGATGVSDGIASTATPTYEPAGTPEPASLLLFGGMSLGMGGAASRRWWKGSR